MQRESRLITRLSRVEHRGFQKVAQSQSGRTWSRQRSLPFWCMSLPTSCCTKGSAAARRARRFVKPKRKQCRLSCRRRLGLIALPAPVTTFSSTGVTRIRSVSRLVTFRTCCYDHRGAQGSCVNGRFIGFRLSGPGAFFCAHTSGFFSMPKRFRDEATPAVNRLSDANILSRAKSRCPRESLHSSTSFQTC